MKRDVVNNFRFLPCLKPKKRVTNKLSENQHGYIISESCPPCDPVVSAESLLLELVGIDLFCLLQ